MPMQGQPDPFRVTTPAPLGAAEERALMGDPWFAALSGGLQVGFCARSAVSRVPSGQTLCMQGAIPEVWYGLVAGAVKLCSYSEAGDETIFEIVEPGQWFGDVPLMDRHSQPYTVQTLAPSTVLLMRRSALCELQDAWPELVFALGRLNWNRTLRLLDRLADFTEKSLEARTRRQIEVLAQRFGQPATGGSRIGLQLPQSELAAFVGASRQRISTTLRKLERDGEIHKDRGCGAISPGSAIGRGAHAH